MKPFLIPIALISFTIVCLSIVHFDNLKKLETELEKHKENTTNSDLELMVDSL